MEEVTYYHLTGSGHPKRGNWLWDSRLFLCHLGLSEFFHLPDLRNSGHLTVALSSRPVRNALPLGLHGSSREAVHLYGQSGKRHGPYDVYPMFYRVVAAHLGTDGRAYMWVEVPA